MIIPASNQTNNKLSTKSSLQFLSFWRNSLVQYNTIFLSILGQINPIHTLYYLLFPKHHLYFCTHCTCYMTLPFHSPLFHQPVQFGKQYKSWSYSLYNTFQLSVTPSFLCLTFPQPPHNNKHCVRKTECKTLSLEVPFCVVFFRMTCEYQIC